MVICRVNPATAARWTRLRARSSIQIMVSIRVKEMVTSTGTDKLSTSIQSLNISTRRTSTFLSQVYRRQETAPQEPAASNPTPTATLLQKVAIPPAAPKKQEHLPAAGNVCPSTSTKQEQPMAATPTMIAGTNKRPFTQVSTTSCQESLMKMGIYQPIYKMDMAQQDMDLLMVVQA